MILANENLMVLRQAKALLMLGKAAAAFGENGLAKSTLMHAKKLAADGAATLTAFTAEAIARIVPLLPKEPRSWIVAGGGARNLTMVRMLRERLDPATVEAADALGWSADAIEAQAFGFLAARGLKGLPLSYPATTGVPIPMTGGVIVQP